MRKALLLSFVVACGAPAAIPTPAASPAPSAAPPATVSVAPPVTAPSSLGQLEFPVTGSRECQAKFREGMLAMHSFEYDQAHTSFEAALAADTACAMAAWGDAMTYEHPIWRERDLTKGRAALARAKEDAISPKERAFIAAARAFYAIDDGKEAHKAWLAAAAKMHADYADDDEVSLWYALSLLSVYGYDVKHVRGQMEAGAIALDVLQRRPEHPGAAHYAIHAFDSREHAILALPAARTYARIAPAAGHAQHMPSHTFVHLGMWREVVPSNIKGYESSVAWEKSRGHTPSEYDWHSYSWLIAAHMELGQWQRGKALVDGARALLIAEKGDMALMRAAYVDMVSVYLLHTDRWGEAEALLAPVLTAMPDEGGGHGVACAMHAPGGTGETRMPYALFARLLANAVRAEAALHAGDKDAVAKRLADIKAVRADMSAWAKMMPPDYSARWDAVVEALAARAAMGTKPAGDAQKKAIAAYEKVVRIETSRSTAGPAFTRTGHEVFAELLVGAGRTKDALVELERDLDERPGHGVALLAAARIAKNAGDTQRARKLYATLADLWQNADADLPALAEVRDGAK
jgi:hypothetical protein